MLRGGLGTTRVVPDSTSRTKGMVTKKGIVPTQKFVDLHEPRAKKWLGNRLAKAALPAPHGEYNISSLSTDLSMKTRVGKNATDISFYKKPLGNYGDVGLMSTQKKIRGNLHDMGEVMAAPKAVVNKDVLTGFELPRATGTNVYDPKKVPRGLAKELKSGGAIPLNARFYRRLKAYKKLEKPNPVKAKTHDEVSVGNLGYPHIETTYPDIASRINSNNKAFNLVKKGFKNY